MAMGYCDICGAPALRHFGRLIGVAVSPWGSGQGELRLCEVHTAAVLDFLLVQRSAPSPAVDNVAWPVELELSRWSEDVARCDLCLRERLGRMQRTEIVAEWTAITSCSSCATPEVQRLLGQLKAAATISSVVGFTREEAVERLRAVGQPMLDRAVGQ